jgi:hypothetical protein
MKSIARTFFRSAGALALALGFTASSTALAEQGPLTLSSKVPVGLIEAKGVVVGLEEESDGTTTTHTAVAFTKGKWKKAKIGVKTAKYEVADQVEAVAPDKATLKREGFDNDLAKFGVVEAAGLSGNLTGRYRVLDWGLVVYAEENQVLARIGDASEMTTLPVVKDVDKWLGKCAGSRETKLTHVVAMIPWKGVGVVVESTCTPAEEGGATTRVRRFAVADVSKIVP